MYPPTPLESAFRSLASRWKTACLAGTYRGATIVKSHAVLENNDPLPLP